MQNEITNVEIKPVETVANQTKFYTKNEITFGTFLGGPLAGIYFLSQNFGNLGDQASKKKYLLNGTIYSLLFFTLIFIIPEGIMNLVPQYLLPAAYTAIMYYLFAQYQEKAVTERFNTGSLKESGWKVFGISMLALLISVIYMVAIVLMFFLGSLVMNF
jgi:hypothetical protein